MKIFGIVVLFFLSACSTGGKSTYSKEMKERSVLWKQYDRAPLIPIGSKINENATPVIRGVVTNSEAYRSGLRTNDQVTAINGRPIHTVEEALKMLKASSGPTKITFRRASQLGSADVQIKEREPYLGAFFAKPGQAYIRKNSPQVAFVNSGDITVYAQGSRVTDQNEIRLNFILDSLQFKPASRLKYRVVDKKSRAVLASGEDVVSALGVTPAVLSKDLSLREKPKGSMLVSLEHGTSKFLFEFQ